MIKAIIIDDDSFIRDTEKRMINDYFTEIEIIGEAETVVDGVRILNELKPDLVFMDIELKDGTGFQILQKMRPLDFKFIIVTAFNEFALKAIKFSALDYIVKPINEHEFRTAVEKALQQIENVEIESQISNFFSHYEKKMQSKKIVLKTSDHLHLIDISDIIYCKSDNSYTTFYINNGEEIIVSKSIKEYEDLLCDYRFFRPHQSYLVNLNYAKKLNKSDGGSLVMKNKVEIPISSRKKLSLIQVLEKL
ncbi:MAG: response regulator transcription factor [Candidatus Delongbacteria bacterium]|nr:response regulator transcription factor [Candidatus Delongbacteria bacterium]MBN2834958.1 response regulator transcription factor [Candidatus Delongbacteria bacterium]